MAQLINAFDATQHNPEQSSGSLPIGKSPVVIESSEVKGNKAGDGGFLQLNLRVIDGPNNGATGPYRLNLYSSSEAAVAIANKNLSAICHAVNVFQVQDSQVLHNIPFVVDVGPQKDNPQYTEVKRIYDINGNEPGKAPAGAAQTQQQAAPANNGQWGGQQQQAPANTGAPAQAGWGQQPAQQAQPEPNAAPQNAGGAWGAPAGAAQPAWGQGQQQQPANNGGGAWNQNAGGAPAATGNAPWGTK